MKRFALALLAFLAFCTGAEAQCTGQFTPGQFCGNSTAASGLAKQVNPSAMFDRAFCNTANAFIQRAGGTWGCPTPSGTLLDQLTGFAGTGVISRTGAGTYTFSSIATLTGRTRMAAPTSFFVRTAPVNVTSITNASPAVINATGHGLSINDPVVFGTSGTLPTGLTVGQVYFVISAGFGANAFEVSLTQGGAAINTSSAGSGTHNFQTGNDANTCLAATRAAACLTIQSVYDLILQSYDLAGNQATINVAAGTYLCTRCINVFNAPPLGTASASSSGIQIIGDTTTPANVVLSSNDATIFSSFGGEVNIAGVKLTSSASNTIYASAHGRVNIVGNVEFGTAAAFHMQANVNGAIVVNGAYRISGSAGGHMYASKNSSIELNAATVTITNTPAFSVFASSVDLGMISAPGMTWSGSATGKRYDATQGKIATGTSSTTYFPGNSAGTTADGGVYDTGLLSQLSATGGIVALTNTATFFDGASVAQGSIGTWFVTATASFADNAGVALFTVQLTDGTTAKSTYSITAASGFSNMATVSAIYSAPAGNLKIQVKNLSGTVTTNITGSNIIAIRLN